MYNSKMFIVLKDYCKDAIILFVFNDILLSNNMSLNTKR